MAIVNNISTEFGDVIRIQSDVPVIGLISLNSFVDDTVGEGVDKSFQKKFRYSINGGLTFSEWFELTTINLQNVSVTKYDSFIIDYTYTHVGVDGDLAFNSLTLTGDFGDLDFPVFRDSFFYKYQWVFSICTLSWAINVLEKLYAKGLLASYIKRGESDLGNIDADFIAFWYTLTHFFAIIVCFARKFEDIPGNEIFLRKFIQGKGLYISNSTSYEELLYLYENYINEFKKRGTLDIIKSKLDGNTIDGELLRLISKEALDEFMFALCKPEEIGWNVGNSSPMYRNTNRITNLIKAYEFTNEIVDIDLYPAKNYLNMQVAAGWLRIYPDSGDTGIGYTPLTNDSNYGFGYGSGAVGDNNIYFEDSNDYRILIDPSLDYEISFRIKQAQIENVLYFGVTCLDRYDNSLILKSAKTNIFTNYFFEAQSMKIVNQEYWIRGILFNSSKVFSSSDELNISIGNNLILHSDAKYIIPEIFVRNNSGLVSITDIKVMPLNLDFSKGYLGARNMIVNYFKNNSPEFSDSKIVEIIRRYLLQYNTIYKEILI